MLKLRRTDEEELADLVEKLFSDGVEELYVKADARNFLIIDVAPKNRSPSGTLIPFVLKLILE